MNPREVSASLIEQTVKELCVEANTVLRPDVLKALEDLYSQEEDGSLSQKMLAVLLENAKIASVEGLPICQDTGMVNVYVDVGRDAAIKDGHIEEAVNSGVEKAYTGSFFRNSVVADPIIRDNTGTNTPAIIHVDIVDGDRISISVMPKGFGSENKGRTAMLNPTSDAERIIDFCVETVKIAGPDACPPYVLGVGVGGTMEHAAFLAKKALLRPLSEYNPKKHIADMEQKVKERANALGIGVMGLGGTTTVMGVNILEAPTHIAGLPVAVNLCCHALRSACAVI